jgi:predicted  nucleic acid-binding Zn-ribbon protein
VGRYYIHQTGEIVMSNRENDLEKLEAQLGGWKLDLQELEAEVQKVEGDIGFRCREKIKALHQKTEEIRQTLSQIGKTDYDDQDEFRQGLNTAWTSLKENLSKAKTEFRRSYRGKQNK